VWQMTNLRNVYLSNDQNLIESQIYVLGKA